MNIFKNLFSSIKTLIRFRRWFFFSNTNPAYARYEIGEWTYGRPSVRRWNKDVALKMGKFCSIAEGVVILLGGEHRTDWVSTYPFGIVFKEAKNYPGHPASRGDIIIGNDVWIGRDALIRSGVTIGNGAVIGARSVVTHDVAPYTIVAGNPAKRIRERFSAEQIAALQRIAWWDWPLPEIRAALPLMLAPDIQKFIDRYDPQSPTT